jgi:hypothetical protein
MKILKIKTLSFWDIEYSSKFKKTNDVRKRVYACFSIKFPKRISIKIIEKKNKTLYKDMSLIYVISKRFGIRLKNILKNKDYENINE